MGKYNALQLVTVQQLLMDWSRQFIGLYFKTLSISVSVNICAPSVCVMCYVGRGDLLSHPGFGSFKFAGSTGVVATCFTQGLTKSIFQKSSTQTFGM